MLFLVPVNVLAFLKIEGILLTLYREEKQSPERPGVLIIQVEKGKAARRGNQMILSTVTWGHRSVHNCPRPERAHKRS